MTGGPSALERLRELGLFGNARFGLARVRRALEALGTLRPLGPLRTGNPGFALWTLRTCSTAGPGSPRRTL